jgi:hypothetical protein
VCIATFLGNHRYPKQYETHCTGNNVRRNKEVKQVKDGHRRELDDLVTAGRAKLRHSFFLQPRIYTSLNISWVARCFEGRWN